MNSVHVGYAVIIRSQNGNFLAHSKYAVPAVFRKWRDAQSYRRELKEHGLRPGKIVRVKVQVEVINQGN